MHESPTRARQHRTGHRRKAVALLAAAALSASPAPLLAAAASDPIVTGTLPPAPAAHELRIEHTQAGREGLELAARLSETSNLIMLPIGWTVRRAVAADALGGETVLKRDAAVTDLKLEPGDYLVEATYGYVRVAHAVRVEPGRHVGLTLILNVGGVRALSTIEALGLPEGVAASHRLYALNGASSGREIVSSAGQGEVLRLPAGAYRLESRFVPGNVVAETRVQVKPGILSSVEIAHEAGVAVLEVPGGETGTDWEIASEEAPWSATGSGSQATLVLAPGDYVVSASLPGQRVTQRFTVRAGETAEVRLAD